MKVKKIGALCRAAKVCVLFNELSENGEIIRQWISNKRGMWPVYGLPELSEANLGTLFDFSENQMKDIYTKETELPGYLYDVIHDARDGEPELQESPLRIVVDGQELMAVEAGGVIRWLRKELLAPSLTKQTRLVLRKTANGYVIAVLDGMFLSGLIFPVILGDNVYREMFRLGCSAPNAVTPQEETEDEDES